MYVVIHVVEGVWLWQELSESGHFQFIQVRQKSSALILCHNLLFLIENKQTILTVCIL